MRTSDGRSEQAAHRSKSSGESSTKSVLSERHKAIIGAAKELGLLSEKDRRISSRVSSKLVKAAKEKSGITSDSELIKFALANLAMEDNFGETLSRNWGALDPEADLGT